MSCHINISTTEVRKEFRNSWYKRKSVKFNGRMWEEGGEVCLLFVVVVAYLFPSNAKEYIYFFSLFTKEDLVVSVEGKKRKYSYSHIQPSLLFTRTRRDFNFAIENNYPSRLYTHVNALFYVLILSRVYIFPLCVIFFWYEAINKMKAVQWLNFKTSSLSVWIWICVAVGAVVVIIHKELSTRFSTFICWKMWRAHKNKKKKWKMF